MDSSNVNVVATGDAAKVSHAKPKSRVDDKNVQNVDFLDIMNRLTAKQAAGTQKTAKAEGTKQTSKAAKAEKAQVSAHTDEATLDTLDEILSEYGAENLNADILMDLMSMYTTDSSVNSLLNADDPMAMVQGSLYSAVLDNTAVLQTGGEMIDEISDGYFDDLLNVMGSSKALDSLFEVLSSVQDADELARALRTISGITVTSEVNEVDQTVNVLSEQLNLSKAVMSAKASLENGEAPTEGAKIADDAPVSLKEGFTEESADNTGQIQGGQATARAQSKPPTQAAKTEQAADVQNAPEDTAAQAMGFVDYSRGAELREVMTEGTPEERAVFNQTLDLLSRAITEERQLYTARLHPEGLGEVIIRMEKSSAGLVFDILATNEKTAQMINAKLMQLQNGMSEYEAKINPAVVTSASNAESASGFTFDDFTGGFGGSAGDAYSGNRQRAGVRYSEAGEDEREAKTTGYRSRDILNRTI
ncbi:MAG: hypothetical protein IJM75_06570 [Ruminococcus sp.]|nr:hypothetical protein [Ruminococcus sp.]